MARSGVGLDEPGIGKSMAVHRIRAKSAIKQHSIESYVINREREFVSFYRSDDKVQGDKMFAFIN